MFEQGWNPSLQNCTSPGVGLEIPVLSRAHTVRFLKSPYGLYLSDCTNMMIMSHYGISVVINVRLYDSKDKLKNECAQENLSGVLHYQPIHVQWLRTALHCIFKKNSVCSSTYPYENSGATSVYIEKATYQINSVSGGWERRSLWLIE